LSEVTALRLGFAGTPEFAVPALEALAARYAVRAVFTQPDRGAGRGLKVHDGPVKAKAMALKIPVHQPPRFNAPENLERLRGLELDALVVVAYGLLLSVEALAVPRLGCLNIHASLLPRWRGAAPIQRALLAGDRQTGVTVMRMEPSLDTGPMLAARAIDLDPADTAQTLHDRLARLGAELIVPTLEAWALGGIREIAQPAAGASYAAKIDKSEAAIDWRRDADDIARAVRAFYPRPIAQTRLDGEQLRILEARSLDEVSADYARAMSVVSGTTGPGAVLGARPEGIDVECGRGVLRIGKLQLAGRKPLAATEFLQGRHQLVTRLGPS
jgi:methionyl-tRNA formyltransferase